MKYFWTILLVGLLNVNAQETPRFKKSSRNNLYALFTHDHSRITKYKFTDADDCYSSGICIASINNKWGAVDFKGKVKIPFEYDELYGGYSYLMTVSKNGKYGFIDKTGKIHIPLIYDNADELHEGRAQVLLNDSIFIINTKGKRLNIPLETYENFTIFNMVVSDVIMVEINWKYAMVEKSGKVLTPFKYCHIKPTYHDLIEAATKLRVSEGWCSAITYSGQGVLNHKGEEVIPTIYDDVYVLPDAKLVETTKGLNYFLYDLRGNQLMKSKDYIDVKQLTDTLFEISSENLTGIVNKEGKIIIPPIYNDSHFLYQRLFQVRFTENETNKYKLFDITGKPVIPFSCQKMAVAKNGTIMIKKDNQSTYQTLDNDGTLLFENDFDDLKSFTLADFFIVKKDDKWTFLDTENNLITDFKYDDIEAFDKNVNQWCLLRIGSKAGVFNEDAQEVLPVEYDRIYLRMENDARLFEVNQKNILNYASFSYFCSNLELLLQKV